MSRWRTVLLVMAVSVATGCSMLGADPGPGRAGGPGSTPTTAAGEPRDRGLEGFRVTRSGFGQSGQTVSVAGLVENDQDVVGRLLTVRSRLLDGGGELLATEDSTHPLGAPGTTVAVGTSVRVTGDPVVAAVEVTLVDTVPHPAGGEAVPEVEVGAVQVAREGPDRGGSVHIRAALTNPTDRTIEVLEVRAVCFSADGRIIGGGAGVVDLYPSLTADADLGGLVEEGTVPDRCEAYPNGSLAGT